MAAHNPLVSLSRLKVKRLDPGRYQEVEAPLFQSATRVQESVLATIERRALLWMAQRLPAAVNSDHLTALGFAAQFLAGVCYALSSIHRYFLLAATLCLFLNWFGDSLDGTLARVRNQQRPRYGFYVDHIVDSFGALFLMGGLALSGYLHPLVAIGMLIAFLLLSIEVYLATYTLDCFRLSYGGFGPTEIRVLLAIGNVTLLFHPTVTLLGQRYLLFDVGGVIAIAGMLFILLISVGTHTIQLYRKETLR